MHFNTQHSKTENKVKSFYWSLITWTTKRKSIPRTGLSKRKRIKAKIQSNLNPVILMWNGKGQKSWKRKNKILTSKTCRSSWLKRSESLRKRGQSKSRSWNWRKIKKNEKLKETRKEKRCDKISCAKRRF